MRTGKQNQRQSWAIFGKGGRAEDVRKENVRRRKTAVKFEIVYQGRFNQSEKMTTEKLIQAADQAAATVAPMAEKDVLHVLLGYSVHVLRNTC